MPIPAAVQPPLSVFTSGSFARHTALQRSCSTVRNSYEARHAIQQLNQCLALVMNQIHGSVPSSTLILGGARSGKSAYAEKLILGFGDAPHYVATTQVADSEMQQRVQHHKRRRGAIWTVTEEPVNLCAAIKKAPLASSAILVDCLTMWLSNLMYHQRNVDADIAGLIEFTPRIGKPIVFVSNEVGMGIVPENALARTFRDHQGQLNQKIAAVADRVELIAAGLPLKLKP